MYFSTCINVYNQATDIHQVWMALNKVENHHHRRCRCRRRHPHLLNSSQTHLKQTTITYSSTSQAT